MTNEFITQTTSDELRSGLDNLANQLCRCVDGCFELTVGLTCKDEALQKLTTLINFVLASARRAVNDVQQREAQTRAILETAAEGIVTINQQGVVQSCNSAAATMFGYEQKEIVNHNVSLLMPSPHAEQHDQYIHNYLIGGPTRLIGNRLEVEAKRKDGTPFPIDIAVSVVSTERGKLFTAIIRDLTKIKGLQCELAQAQKLESIGQLATGIAHEINTPTQFVGDNLHFLEDTFSDLLTMLDQNERKLRAGKADGLDDQVVDANDAASQKEELEYLRGEVPRAIEQALDGVERIATIVRAMKEFSHPGVVEKTLVDINKGIATTVTVARNEWKYAAEVLTDLDPLLPDVLCNPGELNQVILNLIVNAAHAIEDAIDEETGNRGVITISTRRDGDWVEIRVADTGTGIPESIRSRIFDPFFTTKDPGKGTGQGLAMVHNVVVEKHDGTIRLETEAGKGTTFIIRLPIGCQQEKERAERDEEAYSIRR